MARQPVNPEPLDPVPDQPLGVELTSVLPR